MLELERLSAALADQYRIESELGQGGMATVYAAHDLRHDRRVAVKVLRSDLSERLGAARFVNEVAIAARLTHPHILPVYDSGERDSFLYYVMPLVEGESLRERLAREGRLAVREAARILRDVAEALAYAHARQVVHRDVKPDNVMLFGRHAVVTDFGVAKALSEVSGRYNLTTAGIALGTPAYMAPEQAAGDPSVDHRADIYAFGVVAYECLAGRPPFLGAPQVVLAAHVTQAAPALDAQRDGLPAPLTTLVMRCLEKDPSLRPQRLDEVTAHLEALVTPSGGSPSTRAAASSRADLGASVAVLPFKNLSTDSENEYFADGITEDIINALSRNEGLHVASRTSAFAFKGKEQDIRAIGRALNAATVLEGSVRQAGKRLRVTAQLVKVADGYQVWSQRWDRGVEDVFAVQDEITAAITQALSAKLSHAESTGMKRAADVETYKLYLKGRFQWNKRTNAAMRTAIGLFEEALERDPSYAAAYAGIADCYALLGWVAFGALSPREAFPKAEAAARKALELDDTLAEAHNTLGWIRAVYGWDFREAEAAFRHAIALNPRYAMAHSWYGLLLVWMGRSNEALASAARAMELDPLSLIIHTLAAWVSYFTGRYDEAVELYHKTLELDPSYVRAHLGLGWAHEELGNLELAVEHFTRGEALSGGSPRYVAALAHAYAVIGDHEKAKTNLDRLTGMTEWTFVSPSYFASVYAGWGDTDRAFEWLDEAFAVRSGALVYLHLDPQLATLRQDPRFGALLGRIGVTP